MSAPGNDPWGTSAAAPPSGDPWGAASDQNKPVAWQPSDTEADEAINTIAPGSAITSRQRSQQKNAQVGGVSDSMHLTDQARDVVLPRGVTADQFHAQLIAQGYPVTEFLVEKKGDPHSTGDHVHWGWAPKGSAPAAAATDPWAPAGASAPQNTGPTSEDSGYSSTQLFARNTPWVRPGAQKFETALTPTQEAQFRGWVKRNNVPFDPSDGHADYDMRGFWQALQSGNPLAKNAIDPNDGKTHYPDFWKTPYSATFSAESQWANPKTAPTWDQNDRLVLPNGPLVYDDKARKWNEALIAHAAAPQGAQQNGTPAKPEASWATVLSPNIASAWDRMKQAGAGFGEWAFNEMVPEVTAADKAHPKFKMTPERQAAITQVRAPINDWFAKTRSDVADDIKANTPDLNPGSAKSITYQTLAGITDMVPVLAATIATKDPMVGAGIMGGQAGSQKYAQALDAGRTHEQASMDATFDAMVNGSMGLLPMHALMKPGGSFLAKTLRNAGAFGVQSVATEALQIGYDKGLVTPDMTLKQAWARLEQAGITGTLSGALIGGGHAGLETAVSRFKAVPNAQTPAERVEPTAAQPAPEQPTAPPRATTGPIHSDAMKAMGLDRAGVAPKADPWAPATGYEPPSAEAEALNREFPKVPETPEHAQNIPENIPAEPEERGFTTNPAKIAEEHALEIARLDAEGTVAAGRKAMLPSMEKPAAPVQEAAAVATNGIPRRDLETDTAVTAQGREVPVRYAVVEAAHLVPSQTQEGNPNPHFPQELQPRDRSRAVSQNQIAQIAQNINPRLLDRSPNASDGAPIIAPSGIVESGNGRSLALQRAYAEGMPAAEQYRDYLAKQGYPVDGMTAPVLVRVREGEMSPEDRQSFVREANQSGQLGYSATERAMSDASAIPDSALDLYRGGDVEQAGNRDFVRAVMKSAIPANEHAGMIDQHGGLSQEAVRRVRAALLAKAYADPDLVSKIVEAQDSNTKAIGGALTDAAADWAKMRGMAADGSIPQALDQTKNLLEAVNLVAHARAEGRNVAEYVSQPDIFTGESIDPDTEAWLRLMFRNTKDWTQPVGREKLADALRYYAQEAQKVIPGRDLLGAEPLAPGEVLSAAKGRQYAERPAQANPSLSFGEGVRPGSGEGNGAAPEGAARVGSEQAAATGDQVVAGPDQTLGKFGPRAQGSFEPELPVAGEHLDLDKEAATYLEAAKVPLDKPDQALGALANWIYQRGHQSGFESLASFGLNGDVVQGNTDGRRNAVNFSEPFMARLRDPKAGIISIHNHPSSASFSNGDLASLGFPGHAGLLVIGHNGETYHATLAAKRSPGVGPDANADAIRRAWDVASQKAREFTYPLFQKRELPADDAHWLYTHLASALVDRAGFIDYTTSYEVPDAYKTAVGKFLQEGIADVRQAAAKLPGLEPVTRAADGSDRPTGPVRFRDGVARLLDRARRDAGLAGSPAGTAGSEVAPRAAYRKPEQLRLLEEANRYAETPEFKRWFGDSKVVDGSGKPQVVYHGTGNLEGIEKFNPELTGRGNDQFGSGFYFTTNPEEASGYTTSVTANVERGARKLGGDESPGVIPAYLSIKNPIEIKGSNLRDIDADVSLSQAVKLLERAPDVRDPDGPLSNWIDTSSRRISAADIRAVAKNYVGKTLISLENDFYRSASPEFRSALRDVMGFDGVVSRFENGVTHWVAWFPEQVKSAIGNRGTFDPKDANILREEENRYRDMFEAEPGATDARGKALPQTIIPGAEHSATQLAKAREALGHGRKSTKVGQKEAGPLFGPGEGAGGGGQGSLFESENEYDRTPQDFGLPEAYVFAEGKGELGRGKWGVKKPDGSFVWNLADSKKQAASEAIQRLGIEKQAREAREKSAQRDSVIVAKARAGEPITDDDIRSLGLRPSGSEFSYLSPVVQRLFGITRSRVRAAMGDALRETHSDSGALYHVGNPRRALQNAAKYADKSHSDTLFESESPFPHGFNETPTSVTSRPLDNFKETVKARAADAMDLVHDVQMLIAPMAEGSKESRAAAKTFANMMRLGRWHGQKMDEMLKHDFDHNQRRQMWEAADEESVARQKGEPTAGIGLSRLTPDERRAVLEQQQDAQNVWNAAKDVGIVKGDGLPSYVPRMMVEIADTGVRRLGSNESVRSVPGIGKNLRTNTGQTKHRKYLTTEQTEQAGSTKFGTMANVVKDIRTLPLATMRLREAVAGRALINKIKEIGAQTGEDTVVEGHEPADHGWFTIDHPSFKTWRPKFITDPKSGKVVAQMDQNGEPLFERVPIYVRNDFEGPLRAVLSRDTGKTYNALMNLKGKAMTTIMYSPLIHNAVEWGRALPAMPGKVASLKIYFEGNRAKRDPETMTEAITHGLVPIGHQGGYQDITSMATGDNIRAGRSWTAKALGAVPNLFDPRAGQAVYRAVDKMGDVWHNTLLWDRVGDLQMGLYTNFRDSLVKKGYSPDAAQYTAAHFANRYAGALPIEAMSSNARKIANLLLFSRSFTLGNLGAMKDVMTGLPRDVQAQIEMSGAPGQLKGIRSMAARKAAAILITDIALFYAGNSILQSAVAYLSGRQDLTQIEKGYTDRLHAELKKVGENPLELLNPFGVMQSLSATSENEPGREDRVLAGYDHNGTAIYARNPVGKIGEEFRNWLTSPLETLKKKLGTLARPTYQTITNDAGFGRHVYDPKATGFSGLARNLGRVVELYLGSQIPVDSLKSGAAMLTGKGSDIDTYKTVGPLVGVTFSKGAPGGPAVGEMYELQRAQTAKVQEAMPDIVQKIKDGDVQGARADMKALKMAPGLINYYVRTTLNPKLKMNSRRMRDTLRSATPEQRARIQELRGATQP